jgi:hypothetical protein
MGFILALLSFVSLVNASISPTIVKESALKHHPLVTSSLAKFMSGQDQVRAAKGSFDTKLVSDHYRVASGMWARTFTDVILEKPVPFANSAIYAGYSYGFNGQFPPQYSTFSTNSGGSPRLGMKTSLWRHFKLDAKRAYLKNSILDSKVLEGQNYLTQWEISKLSEVAYWEWVTSTHLQAVYQNLLKLSEARSSYLSSRISRGDAPKIMIRENEQYMAKRRFALLAANERLIRAEYGLSLFLRDESGLPLRPSENESYEDYPVNLAAFLEALQKIDTIEDVSRRRPELTNLKLQIEKNKNDISLAENDLKPKFDLFGDYTRNMGNEDPENPPHIWTVGLKLEIPIERNLGLGNISAAKNRQLATEKEFQIASETYKAEILSMQKSIFLQFEKVSQSEIEFSRAKELLESENIKFKSGGSNLFLVNVREENLANAEASLYETKLQFLSSYVSFMAQIKQAPEKQGTNP